MSAYLHRLIAPEQAKTDALSPFVRSQSPIAAIDQRLGVDESLGHGLAELGAPEPEFAEPEFAEQPSPQPSTVPTPTIQRKIAAPALAPSHAEAPAPAPSPEPLSAPVRTPKLDPGPLFDFDPTPRQFDETRIHEIVHEQDCDRDAHREPRPGQRAGHEPEAVAAVGRPRDREDDEDVEEVHSAGVSRRAWVRNPVWATMRWSGRTD